MSSLFSLGGKFLLGLSRQSLGTQLLAILDPVPSSLSSLSAINYPKVERPPLTMMNSVGLCFLVLMLHGNLFQLSPIQVDNKAVHVSRILVTSMLHSKDQYCWLYIKWQG